jgi:3',5'-cyclic AMP phosphodiesterase CpdA
MTLNRREFLKSAALTTAAVSISPALALPTTPPGFDFVFFTDTHIQPELDAAHGCEMCYRKIATLNPDFAIMGGDHVFDAVSVNRERANTVFDLYKKTQSSLQMPLHHVLGNHDIFGVATASGASPSDSGYGKKMYEDRLGKTYYSFDHKGWHFIVLDSIQPTDDRLWDARIDPAQLTWLKDDLQQTGATTPIIVTVHVPLVSAYPTWGEKPTPGKYSTLTVGNAPEIVSLFDAHNVAAVLQGHLHLNEVVSLKRTKYITSGAVCGNWWRGARFGEPEGFTVVTARSDGTITTRYESYGFKSIAAPEKS